MNVISKYNFVQFVLCNLFIIRVCILYHSVVDMTMGLNSGINRLYCYKRIKIKLSQYNSELTLV